MRAKTKDIIFEELSKDFKIDDGGRLFRRLKWGDWREVEIKANHSCGYCDVGWGGKAYRVHRILYCLYHEVNVDSNLMIDHINGDRLDNSKDNLRLVSNRENQQNQTKHREGKLQGASRQKSGKFQARINIRGKNISLGLYDTQEEAHEIYLQACSMIDKNVEEIKKHFCVAQYSSEFKGVCFNKAEKKWKAYATIDGKQKHIGYYTNENEAAQAVELALEGKASIGTALSVL